MGSVAPRQIQLVAAIRQYLPDFDSALLDRAWRFAESVHATQKRASGETYFSHPFAVALIATEQRLDLASIIATLLHDTAEDTSTTIPTISSLFGTEIAQLVEGVTKIDKISSLSRTKRELKNLHNFFSFIAKDLRILLIKLCDRLHNMRTLHGIQDARKRREIAVETLDIFAVLAGRMGLQSLQSELEDLAFAEIYPREHQYITQRIEAFCERDSGIMEKITQTFTDLFHGTNMTPSISGRKKTPYSIWRKLQKKHIRFEELTDIVAFRIVLPDEESCYRALGLLHTHFRAMPARFKDYISTPKPNGYRSLHTTILGPFRKPLEVQIRTEVMDQIAEHGRCAHWAYKRKAFQQEEGQYQWLKDILEIFGTNTSPQERLNNARREIITGEMFCFTPQGDIVSLPEGATAVDFAYAVHTNIGNSCIGVRVDGRVMPLWTVLQSGENVEILTDSGQQPSALWEQFIVTGKARSCIRKFILTREKAEFALLGHSLLQQQLALLDPDISQRDLFQKLMKAFGCTTLRDLQLAIGRGLVPYPSLLRKILPFTAKARSSVPVSPLRLSDFTIGIAVHYAECCHPIENNPVVGELVPGQGLVIHTHPCIQERRVPPALIAVVWGKNASPADTCLHLRLIILNRLGSFATVFDILRDLKIRVTHVKIDYRDLKLIHVIAEIHTEEETQLAQALASLRACPCVQKVEEKR